MAIRFDAEKGLSADSTATIRQGIVDDWENIRSYVKAETLYDLERYEEAFSMYAELEEYRDSADKANECERYLAYDSSSYIHNNYSIFI